MPKLSFPSAILASAVILALNAAPTLAKQQTDRPLQIARNHCEVTSCQNTCSRIRQNCFSRGGALINCERQHDRCNLNCAENCR